MALTLAELNVLLTASTKGFERDIDNVLGRTVKKLDNFAQAAEKAAKKATIALAGMSAAAGYLVKVASDAEELENVIQQSFGSMTREIDRWSKKTGRAMGRSSYEMKRSAGTLQAMLKPMVGSTEAAAEMSKTLAQLAVDMGSFWNVADSDALAALRSGLVGETEPLRRFGIVLTEAQLQAFAFEKGIRKSVSAMSEAEKVTLRYQYILSRTTDVQGDAVRTADSFANQFKGLQSDVLDLAMAYGEILLPVATELVKNARELVQWLTDLDDETKRQIIQWGAVAAAVLGGVVAFGMIVTAVAVAVKALALLGAVIGLVTSPWLLAIGLLIVAVATLKTAWDQDWGHIRTVATEAAEAVFNAWNRVISLFKQPGTGMGNLRVLESQLESGDISWIETTAQTISRTFAEAGTTIGEAIGTATDFIQAKAREYWLAISSLWQPERGDPGMGNLRVIEARMERDEKLKKRVQELYAPVVEAVDEGITLIERKTGDYIAALVRLFQPPEQGLGMGNLRVIESQLETDQSDWTKWITETSGKIGESIDEAKKLIDDKVSEYLATLTLNVGNKQGTGMGNLRVLENQLSKSQTSWIYEASHDIADAIDYGKTLISDKAREYLVALQIMFQAPGTGMGNLRVIEANLENTQTAWIRETVEATSSAISRGTEKIRDKVAEYKKALLNIVTAPGTGMGNLRVIEASMTGDSNISWLAQTFRTVESVIDKNTLDIRLKLKDYWNAIKEELTGEQGTGMGNLRAFEAGIERRPSIQLPDWLNSILKYLAGTPTGAMTIELSKIILDWQEGEITGAEAIAEAIKASIAMPLAAIGLMLLPIGAGWKWAIAIGAIGISLLPTAKVEGIKEFAAGLAQRISDFFKGKAGPYDELINKVKKDVGSNLSNDLLNAIMSVESSFKPDAQAVGSTARGLFQITKAAAQDVGADWAEMLVPEKNIEAGIKYLERLLKYYEGDVQKAIAAYYAGMGNIPKEGPIPESVLINGKEIFPREYVEKVLAEQAKFAEPFKLDLSSISLQLSDVGEIFWNVGAVIGALVARLGIELGDAISEYTIPVYVATVNVILEIAAWTFSNISETVQGLIAGYVTEINRELAKEENRLTVKAIALESWRNIGLGQMGVIGLVVGLTETLKQIPKKGNQVGGYTLSGADNDVAGIVHANEWVAPAWMVRQYPELFATLEAARKKKGFQAGGYTSVSTGNPELDRQLTQTGSWITSLNQGLDSIVKTITTAFVGFFEWLGEFLIGLGQRFFPEQTEGLMKFWDQMKQKLQDFIDAFKPQEIIRPRGGRLVEESEVGEALTKPLTWLQEQIQAINRAIKEINWAQTIQSALDTISSGLQQAESWFAQFMGDLISHIKVALDDTGRIMVDWGSTLQSMLNSAINLVVNSLLNLFTDNYATQFRGMTAKGKETFPDLGQMLKNYQDWDKNLQRLKDLQRQIDINTVAGASAGAALGFLFGGPWGALIGAFFGGYGARKASQASYADEIAELQEKLGDTLQKIKETLGTTLGNMADSLSRAFSAETYEDFVAQFSKSLEEQTKSALIMAFMSSETIRPLLEQLSNAITVAVLDGTLTAEERQTIVDLYSQITDKSADFYNALQELGIATESTASQMQSLSETLRNVPSGFKIALERFTAALPVDSVTPAYAMASGGIVTRPTYALIGEAGPEAVIPLSEMGGGDSYYFDFSGAHIYGMDDFERRIEDAMDRVTTRRSLRNYGTRGSR